MLVIITTNAGMVEGRPAIEGPGFCHTVTGVLQCRGLPPPRANIGLGNHEMGKLPHGRGHYDRNVWVARFTYGGK